MVLSATCARCGADKGGTLSTESNETPSQPDRRKKAGAGLGIGIALGAGLGAALGNIGLGVALGVVFGVVFGAALARKS